MKSNLEVGARFGRLTAILPLGGRGAKYICVCDCGETKAVSAYAMLNGKSTSCGCFRTENRGNLRRTHGMRGSREYKAWSEAKQRCHNPNSEKFKWYGARGISVCAEWMEDFSAFYAHIGPCPDGYELDRENNDRGYEPGNVRWVPHSVNHGNRRNSQTVVYNGVRVTLEEYAVAEGISYAAAWARTRKHPHLIAGERPKRYGEHNGNTKLTDAQAAEIRASSEPTKVLRLRYGVSRTLIQGIRRGAFRRSA